MSYMVKILLRYFTVDVSGTLLFSETLPHCSEGGLLYTCMLPLNFIILIYLKEIGIFMLRL